MITIDSLTKKYGGTTVVHDISFTVRKGEVLGIAGLMGAGRSELLMAIFGAHPGRVPDDRRVVGRDAVPVREPVRPLDRRHPATGPLTVVRDEQDGIRFGEIVRGIVRASDLACRLGGEEFAALLPNTSAASARPVAERIRKALERERFEIDGKDFWVTVSAGVADAAWPSTSR